MSKVNVQPKPIRTHEGGIAKHINAELQLRRSIMSCLLWENEFYEDGVEISKRIKSLIPLVEPHKVADMAIEAREQMKLRHIPLFIVREMARLTSHKSLVSGTLARIIQRPDELSEFCAIYWKEGRRPLSAQVKKGLAQAFNKFDAYQFSKYDRKGIVKLKDVLFLCHAKPIDIEQDKLWKALIDDKLIAPDTWEVALSAGQDKKMAFERLLSEHKLGALALLRNLRNMSEAKVDEALIKEALRNIKVERVLPFRFITAARYAPQLEPVIEEAMLKCIAGFEKWSGKTVLLVDVSGSMEQPISEKSELKRMDAAAGLSILARELSDPTIITFSDSVVRVPPRRGFALRDAIANSQKHNGTYLGQAVQAINEKFTYDRLIVFTDEQAHDNLSDPKGKGYVINVASEKNGVGYGAWHHIDGWSEATLQYIQSFEQMS